MNEFVKIAHIGSKSIARDLGNMKVKFTINRIKCNRVKCMSTSILMIKSLMDRIYESAVVWRRGPGERVMHRPVQCTGWRCSGQRPFFIPHRRKNLSPTGTLLQNTRARLNQRTHVEWPFLV